MAALPDVPYLFSTPVYEYLVPWC